MIKQIVIKSLSTILTCMVLVVVVGCGQKGPLQPQPMPEQNKPVDNEHQQTTLSVTSE
jgi:predicted small lipoprotein YifL